MDISLKPIIIYGIRQNPEAKWQTQIIFNCLVPGALIQMEEAHDLFCVSQVERKNGYEFVGVWENLAKRSGEQTVRLARAMENTEGLNHFYILRSGFIALGGEHLKTCSEPIMEKMQSVLEQAYGPIQFERIPERELWLPTIESTRIALTTGILPP